MAVEAGEVGDGGRQPGDAFRLVQVARVLRHAAQAGHALDAREVAGDKAVRVAAPDVVNILRLVIDRVGGHEVVAQPLCQRQRVRVTGAVIDLDQADQQAPIAPQNGHVASAFYCRQMLVGAKMAVALLIEREAGHNRGEGGKRLGELWREKSRGANPAAGDVAAVFGEPAVLLQGDVVEDELGLVQRGCPHPFGVEGLRRCPGAGEAGRLRRGQRRRIPRLRVCQREAGDGSNENPQGEAGQGDLPQEARS